jgi:hypothetical protein
MLSDERVRHTFYDLKLNIFIPSFKTRGVSVQNRIIILLIISAMFFCCGILRAFAFEIDFDYFYDKLEPYGEWIEVSPYGWVWTPDNVSPGWRPYTSGYWIDSDYGCFFASDDDYGWAVYHYGRWEFNDDNGWIWIPDTVWGPGWVAWRCNDEFIGWGPLTWLIKWLVSFGIRARDFDIDRDIIRSSWCFVGSDRFFNRRLSDYVENPARNVTIIKQTRNYTNYSINNKRIVNNSINISDIERVTRRKVEKYHIADAQSPDRSNNTNVKSSISFFLRGPPRATSFF